MVAPKVPRQDLSTLSNQKGQTLIEFVLLLLVVMVLSTVMMTGFRNGVKGFRNGVKGFWKGAAIILCNHGKTITTNCDVINED